MHSVQPRRRAQANCAPDLLSPKSLDPTIIHHHTLRLSPPPSASPASLLHHALSASPCLRWQDFFFFVRPFSCVISRLHKAVIGGACLLFCKLRATKQPGAQKQQESAAVSKPPQSHSSAGG